MKKQAKKDAKEIRNEYKEDFIAAAKELYGDEVRVRRIKGEVDTTCDSMFGYTTSYYATGKLIGKVHSGKTIKSVVYNPVSGEIEERH
ncbi:MAG: hypothetical protein Q4D51_03080 [Eubacteriales bacterium]|nr:hypothetical protein [Eubacteriales bacterium]